MSILICVCVCVCVCVRVCVCVQAIQKPNDALLQDRAWNSVCPLVKKLKVFYSFSLRLGTTAPTYPPNTPPEPLTPDL